MVQRRSDGSFGAAAKSGGLTMRSKISDWVRKEALQQKLLGLKLWQIADDGFTQAAQLTEEEHEVVMEIMENARKRQA